MLSRHTAAGFTLSETLVVLAIGTILATIALPSFIEPIRSARRLQALSDIDRIVQAQERYRSQQPSYAERLLVANGALTGVGRPDEPGAALSIDGDHYRLSVESAGSTTHTVLAVATGAQAADTRCRVLRLRMAGSNLELDAGPSVVELHGAGSAAAHRCWRRR